MSKILLLSPVVLIMIAIGVAIGVDAGVCMAETDERTDQELKRELRTIEGEISRHEALSVKLERAGRSSSNADRSHTIADLQKHMEKVMHRREETIGEKYTILRRSTEVTTGLTDAAKVGTPIANKDTRRRLRKGEAEDLPEPVRRLARIQGIVLSAGLIERSAVERQGNNFERYGELVRDLGDILAGEKLQVVAEQARRTRVEARADSVRAARYRD